MQQEEIDAIRSMDNLILRNLKVTQGYYRLSQGMRDVIGKNNASWPSFATHASKTAGYSIRNEIQPEELARVFRSFRLYRHLERFLRRYLSSASERDRELNPVVQILARISLSVSKGNIMVFEELAPAYGQMVSGFAGDEKYDQAKLKKLLSQFKPGASDAGGQDACIEAFTAYYEAKFAADPDRKAELIYLGNLLIGLHEQMRLQPIIAEAIHAPVDEVLGDPVRLITPLGNRISGWVHRAFLGISRRIFSTVATQLFMAIYLPAGELRLGRDVRSPVLDRDYPPDLQAIELKRVKEILEDLDWTPETLRGSRAANWSDLDDRMNYIVDFFRSHQQNSELFEPPFTTEQMAEIDAGRVPSGRL
jgi:hypothetical protein